MDPSPRLPIRAASGFLILALLGGCLPLGGVHNEKPDGTLSFKHSWKDVAPCAKDQLSATFAGAKITMVAGMAEITVIGNYGGSTAMLVDIQDDGPGKSKAIVPRRRPCPEVVEEMSGSEAGYPAGLTRAGFSDYRVGRAIVSGRTPPLGEEPWTPPPFSLRR